MTEPTQPGADPDRPADAVPAPEEVRDEESMPGPPVAEGSQPEEPATDEPAVDERATGASAVDEAAPDHSAPSPPVDDDGEEFEAQPFGVLATSGFAAPVLPPTLAVIAPTEDAEDTRDDQDDRIAAEVEKDMPDPGEPAITEPATSEPPTSEPAVTDPPAGGDSTVVVAVAEPVAEPPGPPVAQPPTASADELAGDPAADAAPSPASRLTTVATLATVLAVAVCALLAVVVVKVSQHNARSAAYVAVNHARAGAIEAARRETAATLTYDYRTLDHDFAVAEKGLTPGFAKNYTRTATSDVAPLATKTHAISTATIAASGIIKATETSAQILIYADQTVQNNLLKATSRLDRSVIDVSMVKQHGHWLINNLSPF